MITLTDDYVGIIYGIYLVSIDGLDYIVGIDNFYFELNISVILFCYIVYELWVFLSIFIYIIIWGIIILIIISGTVISRVSLLLLNLRYSF